MQAARERIVQHVRRDGAEPRVRVDAGQHGTRDRGNSFADRVPGEVANHSGRKGVSDGFIYKRKDVPGDAAHATVDEMMRDELGGRFDPPRHAGDFIEALRGPRIQMVTTEFADQVRVNIERRREAHRGAKQHSVGRASRKDVLGGQIVTGAIEKLRVQIERQAKGTPHQERSDAATPYRAVPCALENVVSRTSLLGANQHIDVGHGTLRGVVVQPVLEERAFDRHNVDPRMLEPLGHVADHFRCHDRGYGAAAHLRPIWGELWHFNGLSGAYIKQGGSMV